jgi:glycosyltransferase involved in cell wall biosynthesis
MRLCGRADGVQCYLGDDHPPRAAAGLDAPAVARVAVNVLFVCRDPSHASSRVRALQYVEPLRRLGHGVEVLTWQPRRSSDVARLSVTLVTHARRADVVVLVKPRLHPAVLAVLARAQPNVWIDLDDAVWTWPDPFPARLAQASRHARGFVAGSRWLADRLAERHPGTPVALVPTSVDTGRYVPPDPRHGTRGSKPLVVGWIGGPASLTDFVPPAAAALRALVADRLVTVRVVCSTGLDPTIVPSVLDEWSADTEVASLQHFDVGIMPLRGDEQSWGRCGLKALQYMAVGAPVVATPVGAAVEILADGGGVLATTEADWHDALHGFASDARARGDAAAAARRRVEESYSVAANAPRLVAALDPGASPLDGQP